jgi:Berberine and berberine like
MRIRLQLWGGRLGHLDEALAITVVFEPFDSRIFSHGSDSAYPPDRSLALFPSVLQYSWSNASLDHTFADAMRQQSDAHYQAALADGQNVSHGAVYTNYALFDTPLEDMYGANVPRLHEIRAEIDPEDVMGLAGGFKF